ncbi:MAG: GNAT family N-acetyltransferase [Bacteroides sp.]|nr:GNAT family N-acetyltransferase [Bacteroides sp.]MCM1457575.1 GNAT family N-acetyltransferase [Lachnoclostridium sp.]
MTREEFQDRCRVRRLDIGDSVSAFDCYDEDLNDFILNEASLYRNALLSVTYVVEDKITDEVLAYFSLSNDKISISDFENKTDFNRFRKHKFTNQKRLRSYPAIKIGRLAIAKSAQRQSIGTYLLEFIEDFFIVDNKSGCRFITVDAYADAIPFYIKNNYLFLNNDDEDNRTRVMYFDLASLL